MRVVWASYNDYSNLTFNWSQALRSVGVDSTCLTRTTHLFEYKDQAYCVGGMTMIEEMKRADLIIVGHSSQYIFDMCKDLGKRVWVVHSGSPYRQAPDKMNAVFKDVERTIIDSPEFTTLGATNITYAAAAIDTDKIQYTPSGNQSTVFAHYPSKVATKGTMRICEMMTDFDVEFICGTNTVPHEENLERISKCDVYIELFAPMQNKKCYGSFGVTAFESAALGKITVTNSLFHEVYNKAYGVSELQVANDERSFKCIVGELLTKPQWEIEIMGKKSRKWIVDKHSMQATGNYLKQFL